MNRLTAHSSIGSTLLIMLWMVARGQKIFDRDGTLWWGLAAGLAVAAAVVEADEEPGPRARMRTVGLAKMLYKGFYKVIMVLFEDYWLPSQQIEYHRA